MGKPMTGFAVPGSRELNRFPSDRRLIWYDYADLWLQFPLGKVLDYGCGEGAFLKRIGDRCSERWGVDVDSTKTSNVQNSQIQVRKLASDCSLPFPEDTFDTVILMEVLEHVADERRVLTEIARVLRPGGKLLLTTPHRGLLTFLDPGNVKFLAPGLHRFIHRVMLRQPDFYDKNFGASRRRDQGMIADFTVDQIPWHRHYNVQQIRNLAPPNLQLAAWAVYYPGFRALWSLRLALKALTAGRYLQHPSLLKKLDCWLSRCKNRCGDQLIALFEKTVSL